MVQRQLRCLFALFITFTVLFCGAAPQAFAEDGHSVPSFTEEEQNYISEHGPIKVGYVQDRIPISFKGENGELEGVSRYIFDRVSELSGLKFDYVALPGGDVTYDYLTSEGFELVTSVEYNEENKKARGILISDPYFSSRKVIVAREDTEFRYDKNLKVAVSTGSQTLKKVLAKAYPNFVLQDYPSITECFDAVNSGDADLMIQNQYVVEYWFSRPKYERLKVIPVMGLDDRLCFSAVVAIGDMQGVPEEEGRLLIDILDKTIACISEDEAGSYTIQSVMENQYKFGVSDFFYRYRYSVAIIAVFSVVILILAVLLVRQRIRFAESRADAKAKGQFLSTMSHEIRTPLNGLIGLNYLMTQKLDDKEKLAEYLSQSSAAAKYLLTLVNDILDTSKLQAEKLELLMNPVDMKALLDNVSSIVINAMTDKGLTYTVNADITFPYLLGDQVRIQQVLLNLLDNARKFTQEGGRVEMSLKQKKSDDGKIITSITVSDNGKGMSDEFRKHIFDVFSQELDTVSKGNQGTGLGLSISRRLALLMGGDLTVVSKKGEGSVFTFTFAAQLSEAPKNEKERSVVSCGAKPHVLVAEDNELNGEIILELLNNGGFEAELAENGEKALKMFCDSEPGTYDIILMDLLMPYMDGFEATKAIRALDRPDAKTVHIFACTANSFTEERDKAIKCGMDDFISKPVDIEELFRKLNK